MSKIKSHSLSRNVKKVYRVSMKENPKGIHIKPKETFDKIIDQKGRLYLLEGCLVFPLFYYYGDGCLDSHNQVPRLHTRVGCKSTNYKSNPSRIFHTNKFYHNIVDFESRQVHEYLKLDICKVCESDKKTRRVLMQGLYYDLTELIDSILEK